MTEPGGPRVEDGALRRGERVVIAGVLALIALLAGVDLLVDSRDGVTAWHAWAEASLAIAACIGAFFLMRGAWTLRRKLEAQTRVFSAFRQQADAWRAGSRKYLDGLSRSIDEQLDRWQLSAADKEVAFLLLKGLSLREIAAVRRTSEKTARVQSSAVYAKSGLAGRSELPAFFLEDLLPPGPPCRQATATPGRRRRERSRRPHAARILTGAAAAPVVASPSRRAACIDAEPVERQHCEQRRMSRAARQRR